MRYRATSPMSCSLRNWPHAGIVVPGTPTRTLRSMSVISGSSPVGVDRNLYVPWRKSRGFTSKPSAR